jgi:hypothetical protein
MTLESSTGSIRPAGALTLQAGTGVVMLDSLTAASGSRPITIDADYVSTYAHHPVWGQPRDGSATGDGTLTVVAGKAITTKNGELQITAWDIDLQDRWELGNYLGASLNSGTAATHIHASKLHQSVGLGDLVQDMHVTDSELLRINNQGSLTFTRFGGGSIVVHSVSRKYSTKADSIVFGDRFGDVVTSKFKQAALPQVVTQSYATTADFVSEPRGVPRLEVNTAVSTGAEIVVRWFPDVYSNRVSHKYDWVGLYKKGDCANADADDRKRLTRIHKCYLAWQYTAAGLTHGENRFKFASYKTAGQFEVRYFYGDSTDGQGYRCVTLGGSGNTYKQCILRARQTSAVINVGSTGTATSMSSVPGLFEKYCDGSKTLCE